MTKDRPPWATQLQAERERRGWNKHEMARRLLAAAGTKYPPVKSLVRQIHWWEKGQHYPRDWTTVYAKAFGVAEEFLFARGGHEYRQPQTWDDRPAEMTDPTPHLEQIVAWITDTNTSDDAIEQIDRSSAYLAAAHSQVSARKILAEVLSLHQQAEGLLRGGKQRLRQTRELLRIDSSLLAHACLLFGDLGQDRMARDYGKAALLLAREAEASEAIAWSVQAKTARWQQRYVESAALARRGFEVSGPTSTRVELAYREANAIALYGDAIGARQALHRATNVAEAMSASDSDIAVWSFPLQRQAVFALSVAIHTGDPDSALRAAATADGGWNAGQPKTPATWAQIRAGAGIAYLMKGDLDGASQQVSAILDLSPELRIGTVTGYLNYLCTLLSQPRYSGSRLAIELTQQIRDFNSGAALDTRATETE